jgi:hypothetical protein
MMYVFPPSSLMKYWEDDSGIDTDYASSTESIDSSNYLHREKGGRR